MDKLGLHIIEGFQGKLAIPGAGTPRLVKLVDVSVAYVRQVRAEIGPNCLIIVRWVEAQPLANPEQEAIDWFQRHKAQMQAMVASAMPGAGTGDPTGADPYIAFEGYNEVPDHQAEQYVRFELERLRQQRRCGEIFACGPEGMLRAAGARALEHGIRGWLSLDKRMVCGVGACLACVQKLRRADGSTWIGRVCHDGPVFEAREIVW